MTLKFPFEYILSQPPSVLKRISFVCVYPENWKLNASLGIFVLWYFGKKIQLTKCDLLYYGIQIVHMITGEIPFLSPLAPVGPYDPCLPYQNLEELVEHFYELVVMKIR